MSDNILRGVFTPERILKNSQYGSDQIGSKYLDYTLELGLKLRLKDTDKK